MKKKHLNPDDTLGADVFCGLINTASFVFINRLVLGGSYQFTEHTDEILDLLHKLETILVPYEAVDINCFAKFEEVEEFVKRHNNEICQFAVIRKSE